MDADDVAAPERLERQIALMESSPDLVLCGCRTRYFPDEAVQRSPSAHTLPARARRLATYRRCTRLPSARAPFAYVVYDARSEGTRWNARETTHP
jgi:hypothetical protein